MQSNPSIQRTNKRPALLNPKLSSDKCSTFKIPPEERRYRDFELEQSKILKEIMHKTATKIEVTSTKDGALNFCIIGKEVNLQTAKNLVLNDFQTPVTLTVSVPKSIHGRLLGAKGQRLASIQDETQTKIAIPRIDEESDIIKIVGLKSNAEQAVKTIQALAKEFSSKSSEKVSVERIYLLFITGPFNENLKRWEEMGAKVSTSCGILPSTNNSNNHGDSGHPDEVTFTIIGEPGVIQQVKEEILQIYEDKKKKCTTVNIEVKKAQHKYILGPAGANLRELFAKTGVSVELPHESESETITLRGERSKLATALSELYTQAHSETDDFFEAETWMHKYLIGPRKTNTIDFKSHDVDVKSLDDRIRIHGPPSGVELIKEVFEAELENIRKTLIRKNIKVEPRIHGYIIGKSGATVDQIREASGAHVLVPKSDELNELIILEGTKEAVALAEEKITAIAKKYEATRKLVIDQQLHGSIIGRRGETIRSIREKFRQVVFTFPEQGSHNNEITILGPADEVEECYQYLSEFHKKLQETNFHVQVPIKKEVVKYLSDAQSAIRRIKTEHKVKVDLYVSTNENSNNKTSAPPKPQTTSTLANGSSSTTENVVTNSDNNLENKPKKGKANKKQQQPQLTNGVSPKSGDVVSSTTSDHAVIIGKEADVELAKVKINKLLEELATTDEIEVKFNHKLRNFFNPKSKLYRQILDDFQHKIIISFSQKKSSPEKQQQSANNNNNKQSKGATEDEVTSSAESNGVTSSNNTSKNSNNNPRIDIVRIRGPATIAKKAEKRIEALIAECQEKLDKSFTVHIPVESAVFEKFTYIDKSKLAKIREAHGVKLNIPDGRDTPQLNCTIMGLEKSVHAAVKQFTNLVKDVEERYEETIEIASQVHSRLIGAQGRAVKKLMEDFNVNVRFARQGEPNPDSVIIFGRKDCVTAAKNHMMSLADQYLSSATRANNNNNNNNTNNTSAATTTTTNNNSQQYQINSNNTEAEASGTTD